MKSELRQNHPMQPSGEVGRFEVDDQPSPPADRYRSAKGETSWPNATAQNKLAQPRFRAADNCSNATNAALSAAVLQVARTKRSTRAAA